MIRSCTKRYAVVLISPYVQYWIDWLPCNYMPRYWKTMQLRIQLYNCVPPTVRQECAIQNDNMTTAYHQWYHDVLTTLYQLLHYEYVIYCLPCINDWLRGGLLSNKCPYMTKRYVKSCSCWKHNFDILFLKLILSQLLKARFHWNKNNYI